MGVVAKAAVDYVNFALEFRSTFGSPITGLQTPVMTCEECT